MSEENNPQNGNEQNAEVPGDISEVQKLQEQAEKFKNDFLYLRAEFENYKRNSIKERSDLIKFGGERFVRDLLDVVDNFERALQVQVSSDNFSVFKKGIDMTAQELRTLLQKHSVVEVPAQGQMFDPAMHEALSSEASNEVPAGHVSRVFRKPYKMHDKIIRTGQVVVAKKPE